MTQDEKNREQGEIAQSGMVFKSIRQRPRPSRLVLLQQAPRPNNVSRPTVVAYTRLIVLEILNELLLYRPFNHEIKISTYLRN